MNRARSTPFSASSRLTVNAALNESVEFSLVNGVFFGGDLNASASMVTFTATNDLESVSCRKVIIGFPSLSIASCLWLVLLSGLNIKAPSLDIPLCTSTR